MRIKKIILTSFCSSSLILSGCTNFKILRVEEIKAVESKTDLLRVESDSLKLLLAEQTVILRQIRADQEMGFNEIDRKIAALAGNVYESTERLTKIDEKTGELSRQIVEKSRVDSTKAALAGSESTALYNIALSDFTAGRYSVAAQGFTEIISQYPQSSEAELSYYWISEGLYAEKKYKDAVDSFKDYIKNYPDGQKNCEALYKLGLAYYSAGKNNPASMAWKKLIEKCPDSEAAKAASNRLEKFK